MIRDVDSPDGRPLTIELTGADYDRTVVLPELVQVTLVNATGYDMWFIFLSPIESPGWGADVLGANSLLLDTQAVTLSVPVPSVPGRFVFHSIDEDEDVYEFSLDLSDRRTSYEWSIKLSDLE